METIRGTMCSLNRKDEKLFIKAVYADPHALKDKNVPREMRDTVEQLSEFLGAKVAYSRKVPKWWQSLLYWS